MFSNKLELIFEANKKTKKGKSFPEGLSSVQIDKLLRRDVKIPFSRTALEKWTTSKLITPPFSGNNSPNPKGKRLFYSYQSLIDILALQCTFNFSKDIRKTQLRDGDLSIDKIETFKKIVLINKNSNKKDFKKAITNITHKGLITSLLTSLLLPQITPLIHIGLTAWQVTKIKQATETFAKDFKDEKNQKKFTFLALVYDFFASWFNTNHNELSHFDIIYTCELWDQLTKKYEEEYKIPFTLKFLKPEFLYETNKKSVPLSNLMNDLTTFGNFIDKSDADTKKVIFSLLFILTIVENGGLFFENEIRAALSKVAPNLVLPYDLTTIASLIIIENERNKRDYEIQQDY